jgi:imidazolonepropionase-like amidohydrolase
MRTGHSRCYALIERARTATHRVRPAAMLASLVAMHPVPPSDIVLVGGTVYPAPGAQPIFDATVLVHDGRIVAVGPRSGVTIPGTARRIDCTGKFVTAGFWNSHVHFMTATLLHADTVASAQLELELQEMFTRWGFTTVFDLASSFRNTNAVRRRVDSGEVNGPRILTVGEPYWAKGGTPIYIKDFLRVNNVNMPEVESASQAAERVALQIRAGVNGIKMWTSSPEADSAVLMPADVAMAIVAEAHKGDKMVFAHPTDQRGVELAVRTGVDILAHTSPVGGPWRPSLVARMTSAHMALIPTLTLWHVESPGASPEQFERGMNEIVLPQVRDFSRAGGQILFGTDVGYMQHYDTSEEFLWMSRAGMSFDQILASLTTSPTERFGYSSHSGRVAPAMDADLVVLEADPAVDVTALSRVDYTIRRGIVIFARRK